MYEDENPVDAGQAPVVAVQDDQAPVTAEVAPETEPVVSETAEPTPQPTEKPAQDAETNSIYANIRRTAEKEARDKVIAELYGEYGITKWDDYQKAVEEQKAKQEEERLRAEAEEEGYDPDEYIKNAQIQKENELLRTRVEALERKERYAKEEEGLMADPHRGKLYGKWKDEVRKTAEDFNVSLKTAFTLIVEQKLPELLEGEKTQAQQEVINKIKKNEQDSTGSASGGENTAESFDKMTKKEWEAYVKRVEMGEVRSFQ